MIRTYPIYSSNVIGLIGNFNDYLLELNQNSNQLPEDLGLLESFDDILESNEDPLDTFKSATARNNNRRKAKCPVLNPTVGNLPEVPGVPIMPAIPDLSFLRAFNIPVPAIAALFGAYGRGLLLAAQNYAAEQIKSQLIKISQGDECVIEIATKLQAGIQAAAQVQYLMAQPVSSGVTVLVGGIPGVGSGIGALIPT